MRSRGKLRYRRAGLTMPVKGDDMDANISSALSEHVSNVQFLFTPAGLVHPSSDTTVLPGNFNNEYAEYSGMENSMSTISYEDRLLSLVAVARDGQVGIVGGLQYLVQGIRPSGRGRTTLILRERDAQA